VAPIATAYDYDVPAHFRGRGEEGRATGLELFFDLVFVFAVTQLSHALVEHLTWSGAAETLFLLLVVWWAWSYTTRMTNWLDPDSGPVRLLLIAMMAASCSWPSRSRTRSAIARCCSRADTWRSR
jgi:low temperature requirement protein LtrA